MLKERTAVNGTREDLVLEHQLVYEKPLIDTKDTRSYWCVYEES